MHPPRALHELIPLWERACARCSCPPQQSRPRALPREQALWERALWKRALWERALWKRALWERALWKRALWERALWKRALWKQTLWERACPRYLRASHQSRPRALPRNITRLLLAAILLATLTACGNLARSSLDAARLAIGSGALEIDPARVAANPYAQLRVDGPDTAALMVLGNDDDGLTSWYSPDRRIVFLRGGVLAGTHGWPQDAIDIRIVGDNPFVRLAEVQQASTRRQYDWMPGHRFGVEVTGELRRGALETIDILGTAHTLQRFDEQLTGPGIQATNSYWAEPGTGFIHRSRQLVAPGLMLEFTQLKPYRPAGAAP
ncbi:hypothetical protein CO641_12015 [Lysobacteraceae bacterium NML91-0213]|nr:hypothetical protein CO641_12015 [Xanthomonadaceae bacterium NML91-0213]